MRDRGAAAVEFTSMIGFFVLTIMGCFQAYLAFGAVEEVENAARSGARAASTAASGDRVAVGAQAARAALPARLGEPRITIEPVGDEAVRCEVGARIPLLVDGLDLDFRITRRVEMPVS